MSFENLFDAMAAAELAEQGMMVAADNKESLLKFAREKAREIGRRKGRVTADDVQRALAENPGKPISIHALGNAAGSLFKDRSLWKWDGVSVVKSERVSSHGRLIRVWQYIGN